MPRFAVGNLVTGQILDYIEPLTATWEDDYNDVGSASINVPLSQYDRKGGGPAMLSVRALTVPWWAFLAVIDSFDVIRVAGPVIGRPWDADSQTVQINAAGMWQVFTRRLVRPAIPSNQTLMSVQTAYTNLDVGSIATSLVAQSLAIGPTWNLPIDVPAAVAGTTTKTYLGSDKAVISDALGDLVQLANGPDIRFQPYFTDDSHQFVRWQMITGNEQNPYVYQTSKPVFDYASPQGTVSNLTTTEDPTGMLSQAWVTGGGSDAATLVESAYNPAFSAAGFPELEAVDDAHDTVLDNATLTSYANQDVAAGADAVEQWTLKFNTADLPNGGTFRTGDYATVRVRGDRWIGDPDPTVMKTYQARIVTVAGDETDKQMAVTFMNTDNGVLDQLGLAS